MSYYCRLCLVFLILVTVKTLSQNKVKNFIIEDEFTFVVNYAMPVDSLLKMCHFEQVNKNAFKAIKDERLYQSGPRGSNTISVKAISFTEDIYLSDVITALETKGCRSLDVLELLYFGYIYQDIQKERPLVAPLAKFWLSGNPYMYVLWGGAKGRGLYSFPINDKNKIDARIWFLVVKN